MTALREYQRAAIDAVLDYWSEGGGNPLVEMATGTGKSIVIGTLVRELLTTWPDMRVLMLVHVKELVEQNASALLRLWPQAPLGINSAGLGRRDTRSRILFGNIQSLHRHDGFSLGQRDLVLIDEAHLVPKAGDGMYRTLLGALRERVPDLRVAGFTATPYRLAEGRLDEGDDRLFSEIVYSYGIGQAIGDGWLSPLISKAGAQEIDVSGVARRGGEFVAGMLEQAADQDWITQAAVDEMVRYGEGRRSWLVFCTGVAHAEHVKDALRTRGISAEMVSGETPGAERDRIIRAFRAGHIRALTNAMVLTTGFDVPSVDLVAMLRPTLSTGLYVQIVGRGTRLAEGKENCLVLDFAGNVRRHGPVDIVAPTGGKAKGGATETGVTISEVRAKECPGCEMLVALNTRTCPHCRYEWPPPEPEPKHAGEADTTPVLSRDIRSTAEEVTVISWSAHRHVKSAGPGEDAKPPTMRVEYVGDLIVNKTWVCFEHRGFARGKAERWWHAHGGDTPVPDTVEEAIDRFDELEMPSTIIVRRGDRFPEVVGQKFRSQGVHNELLPL